MTTQKIIGVFLFVSLCRIPFLSADTIYVNLLNREIEGAKLLSDPAGKAVNWLDELTFDFDSDGQADTQFRHGYEGSPFGLSRSAVDMLEQAQNGLQQSRAAMLQIRDDLLLATQDLDSNSLDLIQRRIDRQLHVMRYISRNTSYGGNIAFAHLPGRYGFTKAPETLDVLRASSKTQIGVHEFSVETPAERASVTATTAQSSRLSADEKIVVNEKLIELSEGMSQLDVVHAINSVSSETSVAADANGTGGATRLYSTEFGATSYVNVISERPSDTNSSGFSNTATTDVGVNLVVRHGAQEYVGVGNSVQIPHGAAEGLTFRIPADEAELTITRMGELGQIQVVEDPFDSRVTLETSRPRIVERPLLNGSAGRSLFATDPAVVAIRASAKTAAGFHSVAVTTNGERASIKADVAQSSPLRRNESIVVNGVGIELAAGWNQQQVVDTINNEFETTSVFAEIHTGATRLYSDRFGSGSRITVVSNQDGASDSSGLGTTPLSANGVDLIVGINGNNWTADDDTIRPNAGAERGLVIRFSPDPSDPVKTISPRATGVVGVFEHPLSFPADGIPEETLHVFLSDASPSTYELDKISIQTKDRLSQSFLLVDQAFRELDKEIVQLESIIDSIPLASGIAGIESHTGTQLVSEDGYIIKLHENDIVGPDSIFGDSGVIDASGLYPNSWDTGEGYLGFAVPYEDDYRFGWLRMEVGSNASMIVKDYAIETTKGTPIWIGAPRGDATLLGDFDSNGTVEFPDFLQFSRAFGSATMQLGNQNPDFDGSGKVDFADFLKFSSAFQSTTKAVAVPEALSLSMLALGFALAFPMLRARVG